MRRAGIVLSILSALAFSSPALAQQNRGAELDKAVQEARDAYLALQETEKRRDAGIEAEAGDRQGSAAGGSRPTEQYFARQAQLEFELEAARKRYDAAVRRWNDLK